MEIRRDGTQLSTANGHVTEYRYRPPPLCPGLHYKAAIRVHRIQEEI